jgi:G3E family GTPase
MNGTGTQAAAPLPVYLLTGFLGSGKTTLLSRLVRSAAFADTAVIVNEFGQVGLDHVLMGRADDSDTVLLDSGCLCCAMNSSLQDSLEALYYRRLRGEVPAFARVVVETSGLADPAPLVNTLAGDASVARHYRYAGTVALVDAVNGLDTLDAYREAATQVAVADTLIVTKTDLCELARVAQVRAALAERNPAAELRVADGRHAEGEERFFEAIDAAAMHGPARHAELAPGLAAGASADLRRVAHVLRYGIASYVMRVNRPVSWERYAAWVRLLQDHGESLLRVKGVLRFDDGIDYAIQGVRHLFSPPAPLAIAIPDAQQGALVFIVRDMSEEEIAASMAVLDPAA